MSELVECHSGFTYADRPVALTWERRRLEITRILSEWNTPEKNYFRVITEDGQEFELAYNRSADEWQIKHL
jgi:hypothetical protein